MEKVWESPEGIVIYKVNKGGTTYYQVNDKWNSGNWFQGIPTLKEAKKVVHLLEEGGWEGWDKIFELYPQPTYIQTGLGTYNRRERRISIPMQRVRRGIYGREEPYLLYDIKKEVEEEEKENEEPCEGSCPVDPFGPLYAKPWELLAHEMAHKELRDKGLPLIEDEMSEERKSEEREAWRRAEKSLVERGFATKGLRDRINYMLGEAGFLE
jgi:hypothetical protein